MIASLIFLHPELAFGTLLEFFPCHKLHELIVLLTVGIRYFILLACHSIMPVHPTVKAVLFMALLAFKPNIIILFEEKHILAVSCWAPRN